VKTYRLIDAIGQLLQIIGVVLAAPGLWVEHWGLLLERRAFKMRAQ
jgi:hypothetical protein